MEELLSEFNLSREKCFEWRMANYFLLCNWYLYELKITYWRIFISHLNFEYCNIYKCRTIFYHHRCKRGKNFSLSSVKNAKMNWYWSDTDTELILNWTGDSVQFRSDHFSLNEVLVQISISSELKNPVQGHHCPQSYVLLFFYLFTQ